MRESSTKSLFLQPWPHGWLGRNTTVSSTLNYIKPTIHWCKIYPNDYHKMRLPFEVKGLEQDELGKSNLKSSHVSFLDKISTAFVNLVKLGQPGPPNQLFFHNYQHHSVARATVAEEDAN